MYRKIRDYGFQNKYERGKMNFLDSKSSRFTRDTTKFTQTLNIKSKKTANEILDVFSVIYTGIQFATKDLCACMCRRRYGYDLVMCMRMHCCEDALVANS